jgi:hypothetical protein
MINHFRTLMLNVVPNKTAGDGAEIIPEEFKPVAMTGAMASVYRALFGANPDATVLNTRAHQYLSVIDGTDLKEFPALLDPRITYDLKKNLNFYKNYGVEVRRLDGTASELTLLDTDKFNEHDGRTEQTWRITIDGSDVLIADTYGHDSAPQAASTATTYTLPGSQMRFRINDTTDGNAWFVRQISPPAAHVANVFRSLRSLGSAMDQILEPANSEPFTTFRNVWRDHPIGSYKLAAALCAFVYRLNEIRDQSNG